MKKTLLIALCFLGLFSPAVVRAQTATFTIATDTAYGTIGETTGQIYDNITYTGSVSGGVYLKWHVIGTNFPANWQTGNNFGICDNLACRTNTADTLLWRTATNTPGNTFYSLQYAPGVTGTFELNMDLASVDTFGCHWVTVAVTDTVANYTKNITFMLCNVPLAITNIPAPVNDIILYPNPANDELNVVYNANADVKNIAVYNIIGRVVMVYKVAGNSANLNIENIPSGFYFVRLTNSHGEVVTTRKFTKQ